jgi:hypothetical protein
LCSFAFEPFCLSNTGLLSRLQLELSSFGSQCFGSRRRRCFELEPSRLL